MSFEKRKLKWPRRAYLGPLAKPPPEKKPPLGLNEKQLFKLGQKVGAAAIKEIMKRKRIPARRPETAKQDRKYNLRVRDWLNESGNRFCKCCRARSNWHGVISLDAALTLATQCHHKHGRGNHRELLMVESLWIPVCAKCHDWIHNREPERARQLGLLAPRGQYNQLPPELK